MLEEIEFHRLAKLRLEVDEPENMYVLCLLNFRVFTSNLAIRTAACSHTISLSIVSQPKPRNPCSSLTVSSTTRQPLTTLSSSK